MQHPRHLMLVANTAWSLFNFRKGLITRLLADGFHLTIVAPYDRFSARLAAMGCSVIDTPIPAKGTNPLQDICLLSLLWRIYRQHQPDFIIHYTIKPNIYGSIAAHLAKIPSIAITTGLGYTFVNQNLIARIARFLYKHAFRFPREVWFLNTDDRKAFLEYKLVSFQKAVVLHGEGIDLQYFTPQPKPRPDRKFRFLLIARMLWDKGIGEYVEIARLLHKQRQDVIFQLLGDCDAVNPSAIGLPQITAWKQEGIIEYLGTSEDVRPFIAQADCVVLPSYREGIPRTMLEAAAMARPLIVSDAPGCRDVVLHGKTGFICPTADAAGLLASCQNMLDLSPAEREVMGQAGRRFMQEMFDEQKVIGHYLATLQRYDIYPIAR